jgi:uncharacterized membrane protein YfcA
MKRDTLLKIILAVSAITTVIGIFLRLNHLPDQNIVQGLAFLAWLFFLILTLPDIFRSKNINTAEKLMWGVALIFLGFFAGMIYLLSGKKKVEGAM